MAFAVATPLRQRIRFTRALVQKRPRTTARVKPEPTLDALIARTAYSGVDSILARNVLSQASAAARDWLVSTTDFLTPPESAALGDAASHLRDLNVRAWGGYEDADRTILVFAHQEVVPIENALQVVTDEISVLDITGKFENTKVSHRDFMGAILNAGIDRAKIGDINVLDSSKAQAVVRTDVAQFLASSITQIRNISVSTTVNPISNVALPERRVKEMVSVELSLRLDALASAAFKISRSKMADMTKSGLVRINYIDVRTPAKLLKAGDIVSVRGLGKIEIGDWNTTSKGKYRVTLRKYI